MTEQGRWSHGHCNPIYLEPECASNDEKKTAYLAAVDALSDYLSGHKDPANENLVLETAREYAEVCEREKATRKPKNIDEVFE